MQLADDLGDIEEKEKAGTITKAEVKEQKGAAYGGAAGGVGGALGGAAAGAAIGSVVPVIGTAIGGIVGGIAGAWLGRKGGEAAGKAVMSESKDQKAKAATGTPAGVVKAETKTSETKAPINYGANGEALLKQFANQENSPLVKEAQQKVAQAETARKEIEAKAQADAKAKEEATKKAEAEAKKEKEEKEKSIKTKPGQESPEVLLAQLNNNMAQMVKMQKSSFEVLEKQLGVQRSATGNLFAAV
jgi:flagellar biosynthesis GTPase FlhF